MTIHREETYSDAGLVKVVEYDTDAQTVTTTIPPDPPQTRPMTPEESARFQEHEAFVTNTTNQATLMAEIEQNIDVLLATVDALNAITDIPNATINANPAAVIKDVAREAKTIARQTVRIARVLTGTTDTTDSGS